MCAVPDAQKPSVVPGTTEAPANRWLLNSYKLHTPVLHWSLQTWTLTQDWERVSELAAGCKSPILKASQ